jgi:serine/threonine protein kinase
VDINANVQDFTLNNLIIIIPYLVCKLICHKKCYSKIFETCLYSDDKKVKERSQEDEDEDEEAQNPLIDQFTSKYKIPHRQKLVSVGIPSWCAHCGHILPLGRKINYKCEECSLVWHDRCDPYICKHHCGLNSNIIESYCSTLQIVQRKQLNKSTCNIKTSVKQAVLPIPPQLAALAPMKNLKIEDFDLIKCIGKGNFGKVMLAKYKSDGSSRHFAIKILKKHSIVENEEFESLKTEKRIFQMATNEGNPFLVHMEAAFQDDYRVYFVMEFINGGDLMYHIQNRMFTLNDCKFYAAQVLIALEFMHSKGILYRDLKLDNILLTKAGNIKLADYGLSKCDMTIESRTKTFCGTPEFMAPEILLDLPYGFAVDFWAFGVLLYQLLESKSPFYGKNEKETFQSILKGKLTFSYDIDKQGKSLISKLLVSKPSDRIGIKNGEGWKAVKEQAFFSEIDWTALKQLQLPVPFVPKTKNPEDVSNFDEMFTSEEVSLTPYPSFVFSKGGLNVSKAAALFSEF